MVLIAAALAAVFLGQLLYRAHQEVTSANLAFYETAALNLAEAGIEEGLYACNVATFDGRNGWSVPKDGTGDQVKTISRGLALDPANGEIRIRVSHARGPNPTVVAAGIVQLEDNTRVIKQVRVTGRAGARIWNCGLVARSTLVFGGDVEIDSYDSAQGAYCRLNNCSDAAIIAADATRQTSGSTTVHGFAAVRGAPPQLGRQGRVLGLASLPTPALDPTRVRTDFSANLSDVAIPEGPRTALGPIESNLSLPRPGDSPGARGRYLYSASAIRLAGNSTLLIAGPVDLIAEEEATLADTAQIVIKPGPHHSLNLYCAATISLGGGSIANHTGHADQVTLWGTHRGRGMQMVEIRNRDPYLGTVYAPNADLRLNGSADVFGAFVAHSIAVTGPAGIHYDTQLSQVASTGGPTPPTELNGTVQVTSWAELRDPPGSGTPLAKDRRAPFHGLF